MQYVVMVMAIETAAAKESDSYADGLNQFSEKVHVLLLLFVQMRKLKFVSNKLTVKSK